MSNFTVIKIVFLVITACVLTNDKNKRQYSKLLNDLVNPTDKINNENMKNKIQFYNNGVTISNYFYKNSV